MQQILKNNLKELKKICKSLKIKNLYAFGSVMSKNFRKDSDIDFLISFDDDISVKEYTDNYFLLYQKLKELFQREIDIITERTLSNPYLIEDINETKELIYDA